MSTCTTGGASGGLAGACLKNLNSVKHQLTFNRLARRNPDTPLLIVFNLTQVKLNEARIFIHCRHFHVIGNLRHEG